MCMLMSTTTSTTNINPIANGDNNFKTVKSELSGNFSFALLLNCREFLGS